MNVSTAISLDELTGLALQHNPVIRQAESATHKTMGFRDQVRLYPNPSVGYNGSQLADRGTDQHTVFVSQDIVMGQKLQRNANVLDHEVQAMGWDAESQRRCVLSDVKQLFYETLGAQRRQEVTDEFVNLARQAADITSTRKLAGEASQVDVLQTEIQLQQLIVLQRQSSVAMRGAWEQMVATIGLPEMMPRNVAGELPTVSVQHDWDSEYLRLLEVSPEVQAALARIGRARANMDRQQVQAIPNLSVMAAAGYDRMTGSQIINTQVGLPLPLFNQNQGNQSAAYSEYCRATQDWQRVQLSLKSRLAQTARDYDTAAATVNLYRDEIVPKSQQTLDVAEKTYRAGQIDFLQVLTIRRTYFDARLTYLAAQTDLAQAQVLFDELLLSGSLDNAPNSTLDDGLRGQTLSGQ
ncbi:MAG: TolC family protein [Planctomycetales bacterium]|nr:TolC family protein [Planctomycetales bacterium]